MPWQSRCSRSFLHSTEVSKSSCSKNTQVEKNTKRVFVHAKKCHPLKIASSWVEPQNQKVVTLRKQVRGCRTMRVLHTAACLTGHVAHTGSEQIRRPRLLRRRVCFERFPYAGSQCSCSSWVSEDTLSFGLLKNGQGREKGSGSRSHKVRFNTFTASVMLNHVDWKVLVLSLPLLNLTHTHMALNPWMPPIVGPHLLQRSREENHGPACLSHVHQRG